MTLFVDDAYNCRMPKAKQEHDDEDEKDRGTSVEDEKSEKGSDSDDPSSEDTKRFERSDNLRRRSEWFRKRTSG